MLAAGQPVDRMGREKSVELPGVLGDVLTARDELPTAPERPRALGNEAIEIANVMQCCAAVHDVGARVAKWQLLTGGSDDVDR